MAPFVDDGGKVTQVFLVTSQVVVTKLNAEGVPGVIYMMATSLNPAPDEKAAVIAWQQGVLQKIVDRNQVIQEISFKEPSVTVLYKDELQALAKQASVRPKAKK